MALTTRIIQAGVFYNVKIGPMLLCLGNKNILRLAKLMHELLRE